MPYTVRKDASKCTASKPWAVTKTDDNTLVPGGCHATKKEALAHLAALESNVTGAAAERPALVTVPNVEILSTGTYELSSGEATFTTEDLVAACAAVDDPAVQTPRLKLGHTDPRFDGEPALGKVENMRLSEDQQSIIADFTGVPAWLADVLATAYPSRSIEGVFNVTTATGRKHQLMITAVALLGVTLPGVATLEDLQQLFSTEGPELDTEEQEEDAFVVATARKKPVNAAGAIEVEDVRRAYYESLDSSQMWWWIRAIRLDPMELIVDDDEGSLYRVPFTVTGDEPTFGEPVEVFIEYTDVPVKEQDKTKAASRGLVAVYASRAESRPDATKEADVELAALRARLGLADDATEEQVLAKLDELKAMAETPPKPGDEPEEGDEDEEAGEPAPGTPAVPEGMVLVDQSALQALQVGAKRGAEAWERQRREDRDRLLTDAVKAGKFPPARVPHFTRLYDADPEGTIKLVAALAAGVVPLSEIGTSQNPEGMQDQEAYPREWLPEIHAQQNRDKQRVVQEVI